MSAAAGVISTCAGRVPGGRLIWAEKGTRPRRVCLVRPLVSYGSKSNGATYRVHRVVKSGRKFDSVCVRQSEHQIFRKEAGIPDVPGG
jgi:hypothetical protein